MNYEKINRRELLETYSRLISERNENLWNNIDEELVEFPEDTYNLTQFESSENSLDGIAEEILRLRDIYKDNLPTLGISRCPFTGQVLHYSIDNEGLDGLWWNFYDPVRKTPEIHPTFITLSGAMKINQPVENTSFSVVVGPELPYVIPALLEEEGVLAVLSSFKVGNHTAYVVVYYSAEPATIVFKPDDWGTDRHYYYNDDGAQLWSQENEIMEVKDFTLVPWIEAGKLFWVHPEDKQLNLRADVSQCPYLDLTGVTNTQIIHKQEIMEMEEDFELTEEVEEVLSTLEGEEVDDLTPIPDELWNLLPKEEEINEQ